MPSGCCGRRSICRSSAASRGVAIAASGPRAERSPATSWFLSRRRPWPPPACCAAAGRRPRGNASATPRRRRSLCDGGQLALSPDGQWVLDCPQGRCGEPVLLPTGAGEPRPLPKTLLGLGDARHLPDGKRILVAPVTLPPGRFMFETRSRCSSLFVAVFLEALVERSEMEAYPSRVAILRKPITGMAPCASHKR